MRTHGRLPTYTIAVDKATKMSKTIQLTQGQVAIVCDCHAHLVERHEWNAHRDAHTKSFYAVRNTSRDEQAHGAPSRLLMHRIINDTPKGLETDHKNRNTLDNRCSNLRSATHSENGRNRKLQYDNTSGFRGVHWRKDRGKFRAQVKVNGKHKHLGYFAYAVDAARAYDAAARELHGEFARLNF